MDDRGLSSDDRRAACGEAQTEKSILFLVLAGVAAIVAGLVCTVLAVCYILMVRDPDSGFRPSAETWEPTRPAASAQLADDPNGAAHLVFLEGQQAHFYFKNNHAGNILILTGKVRKNYDEPRSFIRLRGYLMVADEKILAERFAYAGNVLSEAELIELPMKEILTRLQIKGGKDNVNVNVPPGGELPFMIVFDNIPDGTDQYRIDPVGSDPAQ